MAFSIFSQPLKAWGFVLSLPPSLGHSTLTTIFTNKMVPKYLVQTKNVCPRRESTPFSSLNISFSFFLTLDYVCCEARGGGVGGCVCGYSWFLFYFFYPFFVCFLFVFIDRISLFSFPSFSFFLFLSQPLPSNQHQN